MVEELQCKLLDEYKKIFVYEYDKEEDLMKLLEEYSIEKIMKNGILSYIKVYSSKHKYLKVLEKLYCKKFQKKILDECKTLFYKSDFLVNLNANSNKNDTISDNITDITNITNITDNGIIYLVQPSTLKGTNRYKIGASNDTSLERLKSYGKQIKLIAGTEYFEGNEKEMIKTIDSYIISL